MSCTTIQDSRFTIKYSTIAGQIPTIPLSDDHTDGTWLPTDLYIGEIFMNSNDDKVWIRTDNGIVPLGGTSGSTYSFIGDYVHISGGTYSGTVYAPTFSANGITASYIISDLFEGNFNGTFTGDGSGLTGINANWLGGTVSNPVFFTNEVTLDNTTYINGPITTTNSCVEFDTSICVTGGVSASYFIGDGSGLTNIPLGTYSDVYTTDAELSGNSIIFTRNDSFTYDVDLTPILASQSIAFINWNEITNTISITLTDGQVISETIDTFTGITSLGPINGTDFYGGNFYGTFNGTYSNDIYTTDATLYGTDAVFTRTDGVTYSLDLSTFSGGGSGSVGPQGATGATGSQGYRSVMNLSYTGSGLTLGTGTITLPITTPINNLGWQQGTRLRVWHSATEYMEGQITTTITNPQTANIDVNIDYVLGTGTYGSWYVGIAGDVGATGTASQTLAQTLVLGNNTGNTDIELNNNSFTSDSDSIRAAGNTYDDARISYEDAGSGAWAPIMKVWNNDLKSHILVNESETQIWNSRVGGIYNHYSNFVQDWNSMSFNVADLTGGGGISMDIGTNTFDVYSSSLTFGGIKYGSDWSANFTNRSLVDKEYVDSLIVTPNLQTVLSTGNTTGTNWIDSTQNYGIRNDSNTSNYLQFGSTGNILQSANGSTYSRIRTYNDGSLSLANNVGNYLDFYSNGNAVLWSDKTVEMNGGSFARLQFTGPTPSNPEYMGGIVASYDNLSGPIEGFTQVYSSDNTTGMTYSRTTYRPNNIITETYNGTKGTSLEMTPTSAVITGTSPTFQGLEYASDYSANFTGQSLVTKTYVDNAVAGATGGGSGATPSLAQVMAVGSNTDTNIFLSNAPGATGYGVYDVGYIGTQTDNTSWSMPLNNIMVMTQLNLMYNT